VLPDQWRRAKTTLLAAASMDFGEQERFLQTALPGEGELQRELLAILRRASSAESNPFPFFESSESEVPMPAPSPPAPILRPGDECGPYRVIRPLGHGGMGQVFLGEDPRLGRQVALKCLAGEWLESAAARERLLSEAAALAKLTHPHIAGLYHVIEVEHRQQPLLLMVMEYVEGRTVAALLAEGPMPVGRALRLAIEIADAVGHAHDRGVVHCDLKPQNVMVTPDNHAKVLDFGLARARHREALDEGKLVGTAEYMPPERIVDRVCNEAGDLYSVTLFEMITGGLPFKGNDRDHLLMEILCADVPRVSSLRRDLPEQLDSVLSRALAKDPHERPVSAGELQRELVALLDVTEQPSRVRSTRPPRVLQWLLSTSRGRAVAGVVAGTLVAVAAWLIAGPSPHAATELSRVSTVGVLAFDNLSGNSDEEYLSRAMAMELSSQLGQIGALTVVPWSIMRPLGASGATLEEIGNRTGAHAVIEGAVQVARASSGATRPVKVRIQMFHVKTGAMLWNASFERDLGDFFALQAQIAQDVASRIDVALARREQAIVSRSRRVSPEAMEFYLRGRQALETYAEQFKPAIALYQKAVQLQRDFAEAHAGLALAYALQSAYAAAADPVTAASQATSAANQAIDLDPELPDGWSARAFSRLALEWNWKGAAADLERALTLAPNSVPVLEQYATYFTIVGRHGDAIEYSRRAQKRDPYSPGLTRQVAWAYFFGRQYDQALEQLTKTLQLSPEYAPARTLLARAYMQKGMYSEAMAALEPLGDGYEPVLALAHAHAGRRDDALHVLDRVLAPTYVYPKRPFHTALVYAALGQHEDAIRSLERAYVSHDPGLAHVAVDPDLDALRRLPEYQQIVERMRFPR
jgi:serine/threonine protein kinase/tetratricopeptide (TPR) repeat protein